MVVVVYAVYTCTMDYGLRLEWTNEMNKWLFIHSIIMVTEIMFIIIIWESNQFTLNAFYKWFDSIIYPGTFLSQKLMRFQGATPYSSKKNFYNPENFSGPLRHISMQFELKRYSFGMNNILLRRKITDNKKPFKQIIKYEFSGILSKYQISELKRSSLIYMSHCLRNKTTKNLLEPLQLRFIVGPLDSEFERFDVYIEINNIKLIRNTNISMCTSTQLESISLSPYPVHFHSNYPSI